MKFTQDQQLYDKHDRKTLKSVSFAARCSGFEITNYSKLSKISE